MSAISRREAFLPGSSRAAQQVAGDVGQRRLGQRREGQGARHLDRREAEPGGEQPVEHAFAEPGRELGRDAVAEHLLDQAVAGRDPAGDGRDAR